MNHGAFIFEPALLSSTEIEEASELAKRVQSERRPVHDGGRYGDLKWYQVDLDPDWPIAKKILDQLDAEDPELLVFYYLEPDAYIHPHRDLTGASLNDRLRFHVPVITNPGVDFRVSEQRVRMAPGDLWCLDTSYRHSVHNQGSETRVHIVVECKITSKIRLKTPRGIKAKLHSVTYVTILICSLAKALLINTFKDPAHLKAQLGMIARYLRWRFLGTERVK